MLIWRLKPGTVVHACNPSNSEDWGRQINAEFKTTLGHTLILCFTKQNKTNKEIAQILKHTWAGKRGQQIGTLTALAQDQVQVSEAERWLTVISNSSSGRSKAFFWPPWASGTCRQNTCRRKIFKKYLKVTGQFRGKWYSSYTGGENKYRFIVFCAKIKRGEDVLIRPCPSSSSARKTPLASWLGTGSPWVRLKATPTLWLLHSDFFIYLLPLWNHPLLWRWDWKCFAFPEQRWTSSFLIAGRNR